jgi:hypothetical protein
MPVNISGRLGRVVVASKVISVASYISETERAGLSFAPSMLRLHFPFDPKLMLNHEKFFNRG